MWEIKKKQKLDPNIIRIGDTVKIINPEIITRIGYPMSFNDACNEAEREHHEKILEFLGKVFPDTIISDGILKNSRISYNLHKLKAYDKIVRALGYEILGNKGFGGKEKKIYTEHRPNLLGITIDVLDISIRKTGIYYPASGGYDYWGEYDYEPGGLNKIKTHKILELNYWTDNEIKQNWHECRNVQIEVCNVEKIHNLEK
jgi:hypothetical protein